MLIYPISVPTPFAVGPVNAYLLGPAPLTLVDCGPRTEEAWEALERSVGQAGFALSAVERLILTHPHFDHAGLARRVRETSGCPVFAHPVDRERLIDLSGQWEAVVRFFVEVCRRAGVPAAHLDELRTSWSDIGRYADPLDEVESLGEGDRVSFSDAELKVLHTPGHARGALCLWEAGPRRLISGDTLIPHISSNAVLEPGVGCFRQKTLLQYLGTLRRLLDLGPLSVLPGHGDAMGDPSALIRERLAFHGRRAERIRRFVQAGARTPWELVERLFPELAPGSLFLAVSEVVGHLDLLAERGEIDFDAGEGAWAVAPCRGPGAPAAGVSR